MSDHLAHSCKTASPQRINRTRRDVSSRRSEAGYVMVTAALSIFVLLGFLGLAVDVGQMRLGQRNLQNAADAAAIAGASQILFPNSIQYAVAGASGANGGPGTVSGACPLSSGTYGLCFSHPPADGPHANDSNYVEVMISQSQATWFMQALGVTSVPLSARAVAKGSSPNCIYALQQGATSLDLGISSIQSSCGVIGDGNIGGFGGRLQAPSIGVAGANDCSGCSFTPNPTTGIAVAPDPLSSLPAPFLPSQAPTSASQCLATPPTSGGVTTIPPGTYGAGGTGVTITGSMGVINFSGGTYVFCGGLNLQGAQVIFGPGTYVMYGGGFQMAGSFAGTVNGTGVLIYNTGSGVASGTCPPTCGYGPVTTWFTGGNYLAAPTSGTYAGILFFQDRANPQSANFDANFSFQACNGPNTNPYLQGIYYFPDATVNFRFDFGCGAQYSLLVANEVSWLFDFTFNNDYHTLPGGSSPIKNTGVLAE